MRGPWRKACNFLISNCRVKVFPFKSFNYIIQRYRNINPVTFIVLIPFKMLIDRSKPCINLRFLKIPFFVYYLVGKFICLCTTFHRASHTLSRLSRLFLGVICTINTYLLTWDFKKIGSSIWGRLHAFLFIWRINQTSCNWPLRCD